MKGRRLPDIPFPDVHADAEPGDYWKNTGLDLGDHFPTNLTRTVWGFRAPNGGFGHLQKHTVRENEDGTITVAAGDGSTNSVLFQNGVGEIWHGYIDHGEWNSVDE